MRLIQVVLTVASILSLAGCGCCTQQGPVPMVPQQLDVGGEPLTIVGYLYQDTGRMCVEAAVPADGRYIIHSMRLAGPQELSYLPDKWEDLGLYPLPLHGQAFVGEDVVYPRPQEGSYVRASWDIRYSMFSPAVGKLYLALVSIRGNHVDFQRLAFDMGVLSPIDGANRSRIVFTRTDATPTSSVPLWGPKDGQKDAPPPTWPGPD